MSDTDQQIRAAAFAWLDEQVKRHPEFLPRPLLAEGFQFQGHRVPLLGPQGIFKPKIMDLPLSISTTSKGPYDDESDQYNCLLYRYRGTDPNHHENRGLREIMRQSIPLIYFESSVKSKYHAYYPVSIVDDDPKNLTFAVNLSGAKSNHLFNALDVAAEINGETTYRNAVVKQRMHQQAFRDIVLDAYKDSCALCRLKHRELLDAAHIIPDSEGGRSEVQNGLSMCKIHHAAYDQNFIGITPDYVIEVRRDLLLESDGPMLKHGLQEMHGNVIVTPSSTGKRPNRDYLNERYQRFKQSA